MTWTLIAKELRQHWLVFLLLAGLLGIGLLLTAISAAITEQGSLLAGFRNFLATFVVAGVLILCNRLVVHEYQAKTQLFLEALPLTRLRMVSVKFLLGWTLIAGVVTGALVLVLLAGAHREAVTWRFVQIVAARTYAHLLCVYAFFFAMGFLGRYRIPLYLLLAVAAAFVNGATTLELDRFGPVALLDDRFAYEREQFPVADLMTTLGLSAALVGMILVLALIREGNVATLLAEKMSHREKVFVALLVLSVLLVLSIYDERAQKAPLDFPGALVETGHGVTVKVVTGGEDAAGRRFARSVQRNLAGLKDYLQLANLPPVFVVLRRDLDSDRYERAEVEGAEGVLVRANFASAEFRDLDFAAWLTRETLIVASHRRATWEPRRWVLDGFALFWSRRGTPAALESPSAPLRLRAAFGSQSGFSPQDLQGWLTYRERVGEDVAAAVAWSGLSCLARWRGEERCRQFLRAALRTDVPGDVRGTWHEWQQPWTRLLEQTCGVSAGDFFQQWSGELADARKELAGELARLPRLKGELAFEALSPLSRKVSYRFEATPRPASGRFRLLHAELRAFDSPVPESSLRWEDLSYADARQGELPQTYARGTRLYWTFAVACERLGCDVISGWHRQEIR